MNYILYIIYAILIIGPIYLIWAISKISKKMRRLEWLNTQEYITIRVDVPRNNDKAPLAAEQMFAAIHGIFSEKDEFQQQLSFEIVSKDKFIQFYIYLPSHLKDFVEGQIYAQYPNVEINEVDDYIGNVSIDEKSFAVCELNLTKPDVYPIKQFTDFEVDPISGITAVMSKLNPNEEIWFQMVTRPIGDNWQERGHSMVSAVRSGKKSVKKSLLSLVLSALVGVIKAFLAQLLTPGAEIKPAEQKEVKLPSSVEEALKSIETKITKLGFETKIRIMSLGNDSTSVKLRCQNIAAAFKQYNTTNLNGFKVTDIYLNDDEEWKKFAFRMFEDGGYVFNIAELASLYHFPHSSVSTPNIVWSGSKKGEPPANLPLRTNILEKDFTVLGETNFRNTYTEFGVKKDDRRRHVYIVGKSGVGKSTLIENMAVNDVVAGRGVIVVDPHGEMADKVLACIPEERVNDVIVFDPADREFPIAFNLLENVDDDFKGLVASGFVGIFKKIFGDSWGPRLEHILRNTVLALLDYEDSTMLDIPKMLTNNSFREKVVEKIKDTVIREFWINEFAQYDSKFRTEAVSPILNKVGQFLSSATIRNIVGQPRSRINIREVMDQEKILVVNLSRGKIGEDNSALMGAMMITKIQLAAMSRADVTASCRPDCYLYVDEFQNFATESFATILSEARKYNLSLTIAHQYIAQLKEEVRDAVFGNAGTIVAFRVGGVDADFLIKEFEPVFDTNDLVNLDKFHIYIKLLIDGVSCPAFSARTLPPIQKLTGNLEKVINHSRETYSSHRSVIEGEIERKTQEEEDRMRRDAELYKKGGLEALLLKKSDSSTLAGAKDIKTEDRTSKKSQPETSEKQEVVSDGEASPSKSKKLRVENIIDGKIYKEKTARGGVKWYIGQEINEEEFIAGGIEIDETAKKMIELTRKISKSKTKQPKANARVGEDEEKKGKNTDGKKDIQPIGETKSQAVAKSSTSLVEGKTSIVKADDINATDLKVKDNNIVLKSSANDDLVELEDGKPAAIDNN